MQHSVYEQYLVTGSTGNNHQAQFIVLVDSEKPVQSNSTILLEVEDLLMIGKYHHNNGLHIFIPEGKSYAEMQLPDTRSIRGQVIGRFEPRRVMVKPEEMSTKKNSISNDLISKGCQKCCHSDAKCGHLNANLRLSLFCNYLILNKYLVEAAGLEPASASSTPSALHA